MPVIEHSPGRCGVVATQIASNARHIRTGTWGVRFGSRYYPDYATPHPTTWDGMHKGAFLTADEADEMAEHLRRAAAWARAQNVLTPHNGD